MIKYSVYGLLHDIYVILFEDKSLPPWQKSKAEKRILRYLILLKYYLKDLGIEGKLIEVYKKSLNLDDDGHST